MKAKILAVLIVALITLGVIWFAVLREPKTPATPVVEPAESGPVAAPGTSAPPSVARGETQPTPPTETAPAPVASTTNLLLDWADRVDQILGDDSEVDEKARKMLELFPLMPEAGQIETAQHIANLLADEDFDKFGRYLTNVQTSPVVQDIIFSDALNRPDSIKLPLLLQTARTPDHPKAEEAREILELYLHEDHGTNWVAWQQEIERWLKENPD
ncbi:MAG: hypothetical protein RMK20_05555 [Verrucomicrobiales bacterium]|nr:hypothetical protein [Verrucomicrobiales bacterium]